MLAIVGQPSEKSRGPRSGTLVDKSNRLISDVGNGADNFGIIGPISLDFQYARLRLISDRRLGLLSRDRNP